MAVLGGRIPYQSTGAAWKARGGRLLPCPDAADADDHGITDITDAIIVLIYMFLGTAEIAAPGPDMRGPDPTVDSLSECEYPIENCP